MRKALMPILALVALAAGVLFVGTASATHETTVTTRTLAIVDAYPADLSIYATPATIAYPDNCEIGVRSQVVRTRRGGYVNYIVFERCEWPRPDGITSSGGGGIHRTRR